MAGSDSRGRGRLLTDIGAYRNQSLEWFLLTGERRTVALVLIGTFGAFFTLAVLLGAVPLRNAQGLFYAYGGLISGNLTLITVVVSINQLLLSRELQTPGELQMQIQNVIEYREEVEDATGEIAPVKPLGFLRLLVEATRQEAQRLGGFASGETASLAHEEIEGVVASLTEQMDDIDRLLKRTHPKIFGVLSVMFETNYAHQINQLRRIRAAHEADVSDIVHESIDDLVDRLREIDVARQYFKTIYLQQELSSLSRTLLYVGLPAEGIMLVTLLVLTVPADEPETVITLRALVPVTLTIGLLPLAILCSFILRTATVTKLTAATLPFTTPEQER